MANRYFRQKSVITIWFVWCIIILLAIFLSGCVPVYQYYYRDLEYKPIDMHDRPLDIYDSRHHRIINVYVPRYRPPIMYRYNGVYYSEPYTTMMYRDVQGRVRPRKIPNSVLRKIHRSHQVHPPPVKKTKKQHIFTNPTMDQESNRRLIRKRIEDRQ